MGQGRVGEKRRVAEGAPRPGPVPLLGRVVEPLYRAVIAARNRRFDRGIGVHRVGVPVISIGNLSVGGTGKTPMVMHVLGVLLRAGLSPCVAMRGYTARGHGDAAPDETDAYRRAFPHVPIVARPDRIVGVRALLADAAIGVDRVVLDDGFQHRQIARDLDIVLVDATPGRSVFEDRLLPRGWLREPPSALRRAAAVVLTHAELASEDHLRSLRADIRRLHGRSPVGQTRHMWTALKHADGSATGDDRLLPLETLEGRRVVGCCAIGHPDAFVRSLGLVVGDPGRVTTMTLRDHDPFERATVDRLAREAEKHRAEWIVVTDKDWSKLRRYPSDCWPCPVVRPDLSLVFDDGREAVDELVLSAGRLGPKA